jgi:hypothetical protein
MPLHEQLKADNMAKTSAFLSFKSKQESGSSKQEYIGFTSKKGVPIYLMKNSSLPLKRCTNYDSEWETHYFAPKAVARTGDEAASVSKMKYRILTSEQLISSLVAEITSVLLSKEFSDPCERIVFLFAVGANIVVEGTSVTDSDRSER